MFFDYEILLTLSDSLIKCEYKNSCFQVSSLKYISTVWSVWKYSSISKSNKFKNIILPDNHTELNKRTIIIDYRKSVSFIDDSYYNYSSHLSNNDTWIIIYFLQLFFIIRI